MSDSASSHRFNDVLVITGDHRLSDVTKEGSQYSEKDLALHDAMRGALESLPGYRFEFLSDHGELIPRLLEDPPEFVLNFCDTGFRNVATQELHIPALFEVLGVPYSGAPPACMVLCYDKSIVRLVAESLGVDAPREVYLAPGEPLDSAKVSYPALLKPNNADGSVGITRDAVVNDEHEARAYFDWLRKELPASAVLIQEYLPGPEYGLALIGNPDTGLEALPPLQVDFSALPDDCAPILAFESKAVFSSPYYTDIRFEPASLPKEVSTRMRRDAERLFRRLLCRDYARFDFRAGADGRVKLIEVNPNPAWDPEAKLAIMARFAGKSYPETLAMILEAAQARLATARREG